MTVVAQTGSNSRGLCYRSSDEREFPASFPQTRSRAPPVATMMNIRPYTVTELIMVRFGGSNIRTITRIATRGQYRGQ